MSLSIDEFVQRAASEERDDSLEALDKIWEEEAVTFGADDTSEGCPSTQPPPTVNTNQQTTPVHFVNPSAPAAATNP